MTTNFALFCFETYYIHVVLCRGPQTSKCYIITYYYTNEYLFAYFSSIVAYSIGGNEHTITIGPDIRS